MKFPIFPGSAEIRQTDFLFRSVVIFGLIAAILKWVPDKAERVNTMDGYIRSSDGVNLHYVVSDPRPIALMLVHGALGNANWWDKQRDYFKSKYTVIQMDLAGHGKSGKGRKNWSSAQYARDIKDVVDQVETEKVVLVGHSMSGPYALEASLNMPQVKLVVLVDTLKNPDQVIDYAQANEFLFKAYRKDFKNAVENLLPKFLFAESTSDSIREQLQKEFLKYDPEFAVKSIEPLYKKDIRNIAKLVNVPVRAINSDFTPTNAETIRKYIKDFDWVSISGTGHYPMLEKPNEFNLALSKILEKISM